MKIAIVEWADAQMPMRESRSIGWLSKDEFKIWCSEDIVICRSAGWLTFENDEFIIISQTELDGDVAESTKIPRSAIRKLGIIDPRTTAIGSSQDAVEP